MYAPFIISSIVEDNPIGDKIDAHNVSWLEQLLNAQVQLSKYGTGLRGIAVVFIGTGPQDVIHQEETTFDADKKEWYVQLRLPYAALEQATEEEVLGLMAREYLQALRGLGGREQVVDFDWEGLVGEVERVMRGE
ncbi:hypothetical protein [Haliscomenobacter sp.]|uniref:hypothetical protein n=1 Tax=Haliscomenobacter sp. TaxID=2717303 RepID=UPI003593735C